MLCCLDISITEVTKTNKCYFPVCFINMIRTARIIFQFVYKQPIVTGKASMTARTITTGAQLRQGGRCHSDTANWKHTIIRGCS